MRTAAMTETRVARDGDRQHVKQWPWIVDSLNCSFFTTYPAKKCI